MIRRVVRLLAFGYVCTAATSMATDVSRPDLSGVWRYVPEKSKLQIPPPESAVFRIDHREPLLKLLCTLVTENGDDTWGIRLRTDGKEVVQEGDGETLRVLLYWDGNDLVFDYVIMLKDRQATNVVRYHLSEDGKTCRATESFRGPIVKYDNIWVLTKANGLTE